MRRALAYVLLNARRHLASSARWFDGWRPHAASRLPETSSLPEVARRSWLLRVGWRRHGLVDPDELPGVLARG